MNITYSAVKDIILNPENPRIIRDEKFQKLVKSITDFPEMLEIRPIVVDENMMVLGWNMRFKACLEAWLKEVPIIRVNTLTEEQKREFIVKDNVWYGEWDYEILANEWDTDLLADWWLSVPEFGKTDVEAEWEWMPEFDQWDKASYRHIIVHFNTDEEAQEFGQVIGQNITDKTKSIWFPEQDRMDTESKRYA